MKISLSVIIIYIQKVMITLKGLDVYLKVFWLVCHIFANPTFTTRI